ncbi:MAG: hypothetical protein IJR50_05060 [Treponema sp.]|nr:hypothetical protein [Treponema sp.]
MISSKDNLENTYKTCYEDELRLLERRQKRDKNLTLEILENTLQCLYAADGNNWDGRGALQQTAMDAQIAAYETFITNWKSALTKTQN